jgi:hypothetical protein
MGGRHALDDMIHRVREKGVREEMADLIQRKSHHNRLMLDESTGNEPTNRLLGILMQQAGRPFGKGLEMLRDDIRSPRAF